MPIPSQLPPPPRTCPVLLSPIVFLAFALLVVFLTLHTDRAARSFSACAVPPDTIQGIPEPRFFLETDSYVWLSHARDLLKSGGWRLRHTYMDNAPYGRPMHWSHLLIWSILLPSKAIMALSRWPAARAVELVGVWVMPFWQIVFLALLFYALPRRIGLVPTALLAFLSVSNECLAIVAFLLKPDHHIFQMAFGIAFFLCLQHAASAGLPASPSATLPPRRLPLCRFPLPPTPSEALRAATAAGVFLGLLYWIGATVAFFVLALAAISLLPHLPCFRSPVSAPSPLPPTLWRRFAVAAITVSAAAWLLEYAPSHFSMHLEVNHPLHWLPIAGVALGLSALSALPRRPRPSDFLSLRLLLAVALVASIPLAILLGPVSWHQLKDPLLARLHKFYLAEFLPFPPNPVSLLSNYRLLVLALVFAPLSLFASKRLALPAHARPLILSSYIFSFLFLGALLWQHRWGFFFSGALYSLSTLLFLALFSPTTRRILPRSAILLLVAALLVADAAYALHSRLRLERHIADASAIPDLWIRNDMEKRIALRLAAQMSTNQWSVAGRPNLAPALYYFSSIPSLCSYYWENLDGWHAETTLMSDTSPGFSNALAVVSSRHLTHLLSSTSSDAPLLFHHIATGVSNHLYAATHTFCGHLTYTQLFARLPLAVLDDPGLNGTVASPVLFRTPSGYARESSRFHIFALSREVSQ